MIATAQSIQADRRYYGVAEGIVTDVNDPEREGRIKVKFPWFDENTISEWCRVSQFYAGPGSSGAFFVPEVDSEVIVGFIHGDMRQPIILGCLYNGVDKPATFRDDKTNEKQILTKGGHRITLADTDGEERIVIVDKSGSHSIEISTKDEAITIQSTGGKLTLAAKEIEIKADDGLTVEATTIEENVKDSISTTASTIEANASGQMNLKGGTINLN